MTRGLCRIIVAVLTLLAAVAAPLVLAGPGSGQPNGSNTTSGPQFLKLSLDSVSPSAVTVTSDPLLTVSGTVTNIGDRVVDDISVRLQRAPAVSEPSGLRSSLSLDQVNFDLSGPFEEVVDRLSPGQRKQFTLSMPLRQDGSGEASLGISEPGVYPLLLNVNGEPAYGTQARLDDARFLLPVLGLPPVEPDGAQPVPPPANPPVATTLLWPLADRPRWVAGVPGSVNGMAELTDDELAASLSKGGRLEQLLGALESAIGTGVTRSRELSTSVCLAVDPDLLLTVQAMTSEYRVLASPSDPDGATREGAGTEAAQNWLDRLRALASSLCTVALPFAQVDVTALAAVNDPDLSARALNAPADLVDSILGVRSLRGVSLPDSGTVDAGGGMLLRGHGVTTAVLADSAVVPEGSAGSMTARQSVDVPESAAPELVSVPSVTAPPAPAPTPEAAQPDPGLRVATFDIWSATALAAVGSNPPTPSFTPNRVRYEVMNDSRTARLQDALGAISWSALNPQAGGPRSMLLSPPQQWGANRDEATALLKQVELLMRGNLATPRAFADLVALPPDPRPFELSYLSQAAADAVPERFVLPVRDQGRRVSELMRALVDVPEFEPTPGQFLTPLRDDLVRVLSLSDRRSGNASTPDTFAQRRLDQTTRTMDELFGSVSVLPPGGVYTLASEQSPLLLVARNDLPVAIRIRFRIEAPAETKITDIGEQQLPPKGTRSFQIPTEVSDSRNLVIPISLTTPEGIGLGEATSVSVRSNAYGQALAIITASAGLLLFVLVGRRLWRRFRGRPDPADEGVGPDLRRRASRYRRARKRALRKAGQEAR
ncbi:hypothetical protein IU433_12570 [Nocardia puris]|uniref:Glycoprotein n=1 Tax=Nocardia puris TaxID=208602 RepID=A0A366DQA0_9NOCA|nr:DUF6049 family protein [Nocardia puris]MBF6213666.1 hypothetical protein [Nocardia puris]MBF6365404.1 hypothetical protein [Nocardia puris]MBF6459870.1 hypothetical protein [Nocardia puris]RBO91649.1 hypothetical protein DFR74_104353 [Nocardia puris]